ncbi:MAG TPA: HAMP domain-containing sensor histidine kinase [Kofleriaceae bacterium]|jgi:signal transduction histidine kinase|nr:HAMP domain-containing sensor histidine kinase [Kofleriaceae bacterium]
MRKGKLVFGIYALNAAIAFSVIVAMWWLPHYIGSPTYLEDRAALVQNMVDRYSQRSPAELAERMTRIAPRLKGELALYDAHENLVRSTREPSADRPTAGEMRELQNDKWSLSWRRIVVRSDDGSMIGVYLPDPVAFPWAYYLQLVTGVLIVVGAASFWFSRRLVQPLGMLAEAARRFGSGATDARANLERDDELGDVGRAFDDMADRTAALISSQRQLMADVSHELRTPLARIRVALEIAGEDPVAAKDVLADVSIDLDEIDQLIADILTTARMESETAITRRPVAVKELADKAISRFEIKHPKRQLERAIDDDKRSIDCDPVLLRRALDNLLDNAAKYSDAPVSLEIHPNGKAITFTVADKGIGMTAEELERAGTPFWRSDASRTRKTGGVGLGLALARRIARAHGGDVTLASTKGQGTTAKLEIPLLEGAP